jgi:ribosome-associated heat shock protein Hsp15
MVPNGDATASTELGRLRIDKWLWAARFYKTRSMASQAIDGGKVYVGGERVKRSKDVRAGDTIRVRLGPYEHIVVVRALGERRGPASEARLLYEETPESAAARATLHDQLRLLPAAFIPANARPTKKDRRAMKRFRGRS